MSLHCTTSSITSTPTVTGDSGGIVMEKRVDGDGWVLSKLITPKVKEDGGFEDFGGGMASL